MVATRRGTKAAPEAALAASTLSAPPKRGRKKAVVEEATEPAPAATKAPKATTKRKAKAEPTPEPEPVIEEAPTVKKTRATRAARTGTIEEEPAPVAPKRATRGRKGSTPIVEEPAVEETIEEEEHEMPQHPVKIQVATRARKAPVKKTPAKKVEPIIVEETAAEEEEEVPRTATRTRKTVSIEEPVAEEATKPASRARKAPIRKAPAAKAAEAPAPENTIAAEPIKPTSRARKAAAPLDAVPVLAPPSRATRTTRNAELPTASPLKAPARKPTKKATPAKPGKVVVEELTPVDAMDVDETVEETVAAPEPVQEPFTEYPAVPSTPVHTAQPLTNKRAMFELPQYPKTPAHIVAPITSRAALAALPGYPKTPAHIKAPISTKAAMAEMPGYPKTPAHIKAPMAVKEAMDELPGYPKTPAHIKAPLSSRQALAELPDYPKTPAHVMTQSRLSIIEEASMETTLTPQPGMPPVAFFAVPRTPAAQCSPAHVAKKEVFTPQGATPAVVLHAPCTPRAQSSPEHVAVKETFTPQTATPAVIFQAPTTPRAQSSPEHVAVKEIFTPAAATPAVVFQAPTTPRAQSSPEHVAVKEVFTPAAETSEKAQVQEVTAAAVASPSQAVTPIRDNTPEIVQRTPAVRFTAPSTPPAQCSPEHIAPKEIFTPFTATPAVELKAPSTPPAQTSPDHIANKENLTPPSAAPVTPVRATSANRKALGELPDYPTTPALAMEAAIQEEIRASAKKQTPSPSHFSAHDTSFDEASEVNDLSISELQNENTPAAEKTQTQFAPLQLKPLTLAPPTTKTPFFAPPTFTPSVFTPRASSSLFSAPAQTSPTKTATFAPGTNFSASTTVSPMKSSLRSPVKSSLRSPEKRRTSKTPKKAVTWDDSEEEKSLLFDGPLQGLTFYVDVVSDSGKNQSFLFETLLMDLGAKIQKEWSDAAITHVLYKDGNHDTLKKVVASKGSIKAVNVSWALECEANKKRVDETRYLVNLSTALPASPKVSMVPCTPAKTPSKYALPPSSERSQPATPTSSEFDRSFNADDKENSELGIYFEPDGKMAVRTLPQKKSNFLMSRSPIKTPSKQRMMTATPMRPFSTTKKRSAEVFAGITMAPPKKLRLF
ncbi:hypothetical protein N0V86_000981 [Didymella sp. IMI 355093]|nr:hypothetical protein N0V86_000981 [Didymella sp. IMI 355093]